jgi:hypothetical protein
MSRTLIQHYLNDLATLRQVGGTHRESVVREAFKDLLKGWARSHELVFVPEYEIESPAKERRYVDGALLHALRMPFGYWEIDRRIKDSYIKASTAQKTKLYDMYARFFRWASDRLHDDGVLALITNRSFIAGR